MLVDRIPVFTITFLDGKGKSTTMRGYFSSVDTIDVLMARLTTLVSAVAPITGCAIVRQAVTYRVRENDPATATTTLPPNFSSLFSFSLTSDITLYTSVYLPLVEDWLVTSGPLAGFAIDLTNPDVVSFTDAYRDSIWSDPFGEDVGDVYTAYKIGAS